MRKKRILICQSELNERPHLQADACELLYETQLVSTGTAAVRWALQALPELILMDIDLAAPMEGIEAAMEIRSHHDIPVIFLSDSACPDTLSKAKLATPASYLVRPVSPAQLWAAIEVALYNQSGSQLSERPLRAPSSTIIPICSYCKRVRDTAGDWHQIEEYLKLHLNTVCTHSICPACKKASFP
ncbi:MAG: response regulator [Desulfomonile tiedjei]|uniref:Response regulator n=1 Tax=Desulfomonile tiedjei TaxID=2358 RepID=A0A9D6VB67_9BACT|nr:response regulator [Desulfomonile tiedjei]